MRHNKLTEALEGKGGIPFPSMKSAGRLFWASLIGMAGMGGNWDVVTGGAHVLHGRNGFPVAVSVELEDEQDERCTLILAVSQGTARVFLRGHFHGMLLTLAREHVGEDADAGAWAELSQGILWEVFVDIASVLEIMERKC